MEKEAQKAPSNLSFTLKLCRRYGRGPDIYFHQESTGRKGSSCAVTALLPWRHMESARSRWAHQLIMKFTSQWLVYSEKRITGIKNKGRQSGQNASSKDHSAAQSDSFLSASKSWSSFSKVPAEVGSYLLSNTTKWLKHLQRCHSCTLNHVSLQSFKAVAN